MSSEFDLQHSNGIYMPHLSPSTITGFISRRPGWYASKVNRKPFQANPNMVRGTAVEHAINEWLLGADETDLVDIAVHKYTEECESWLKVMEGKDTSKFDEIKDSLSGLVNAAFGHFSEKFDDFNRPTQQERIEVHLEGVKRKVVGYLDYRQVKQKVVTDCKCVAKTPNKLSQDYKIQGSIYRSGTDDSTVVFDFVVANKKPIVKSITLTDEDYAFGLSYAKRAAMLIEELEECTDPRRVMQIMAFPNLDAYWDKGEQREVAKEWGIFLP